MRFGVDDPEQWLELVEDGVFERWEAFYRLEPFGGEQHLLAQIAAMMWVLVSEKFDDGQKMASTIQKLAASFMPPDWVGQPDGDEDRRDAHDQVAQLASVMERAFSKR